MPVSHLGLTVSHIPSATSFYLSSLQPLGYHFIGNQGDSIGLGINDADFFISQAARGARVAPTHIAFSAASRLEVRNCYANALNAGGRPSGPPSYRNNDCSCFNAAVEDLDGNTIEFIFRESSVCNKQIDYAPSEGSRVLTWQKDMAHDMDDTGSETSYDSRISTIKSRARTALDLASSTSRSVKSSSPTPTGATVSNQTLPLAANALGITSNALIGTVLGAAAGAAFAYAMCKSERDNARDEASFVASATSGDRGRAKSTRGPGTRRSASAAPAPQTHRNFSTTESVAPRSHRNFSVTESRVSARPPPTLPPTVIRAIEPAGYDDSEVQAAISRYTSRRPPVKRSQTYDAIEYGHAPVSVAGRSRATVKRSATIADEPSREQFLLEGPKNTISHSGSRHSNSAEDSALRRHDSGISMHSHRNARHHSKRDDDDRRSSTSQASTVKPVQKGEAKSEAAIARSVVPEGSKYEGGSGHGSSNRDDSRSHRSSHGSRYGSSKREGSRHGDSRHRSSRNDDANSQASTAKPQRREASQYESAVGAALPASLALSEARSKAPAISARPTNSRTASYISVPEESSRSQSKASSRTQSRATAAEVEFPESRATSYDAAPNEDNRMPSKAPSKAPSQAPSRTHSNAPSKTPSVSRSKAQSRTTAADIFLPESRSTSYYAEPKEDSSVDYRAHSKDQSRAASRVSGADVYLPASRAASYYTIPEELQAPRPSSHVSAAQYALPLSRAGSYNSNSIAGIPLPDSLAGSRGYEDAGDESDGLGDTRTVVPDDSISCVDFSKPRAPRSDHSRHSDQSRHTERSHRSHKSSKHSRHHESDRERMDDRAMSEAAKSTSTVKPTKSRASAVTLPARTRDKEERSSKSGKRSVASYA